MEYLLFSTPSLPALSFYSLSSEDKIADWRATKWSIFGEMLLVGKSSYCIASYNRSIERTNGYINALLVRSMKCLGQLHVCIEKWGNTEGGDMQNDGNSD